MRFLLPPLVVMTAASGCEKKPDAAPAAPDVSAAAAVASAPPAVVTWHLSIEPTSTVQIDMAGGSQHIKGAATATIGSLDVRPHDLSQSKGAIVVDLATFATHSFGNGDDEKETNAALAWLETSADAGTSDSMRWASFSIRSVDGLSATDLATVPPVKEGSDDVRTATMTLHGDLVVHGHKLQRDALVAVSIHQPSGAQAESTPTRVVVTSSYPLRLRLEDLDVRPRDASGRPTPWTAAFTGKVGPDANVTVSLSAKPTR